MTKKRPFQHRERTTLTLGRTHTRHNTMLDFPAWAALAYAQAQAKHLGGLKVPSAAIVRRALLVYALHLQREAAAEDASRRLTEWRAIKAATAGGIAGDALHGTGTEAEAQAQAEGRLQALALIPEGQPLPSFIETLVGPSVVAARAAARAELDRRLDAMPAFHNAEPVRIANPNT